MSVDSRFRKIISNTTDRHLMFMINRALIDYQVRSKQQNRKMDIGYEKTITTEKI